MHGLSLETHWSRQGSMQTPLGIDANMLCVDKYGCMGGPEFAWKRVRPGVYDARAGQPICGCLPMREIAFLGQIPVDSSNR